VVELPISFLMLAFVLFSASTQPGQEGGICPSKLVSSGSCSPFYKANSYVSACDGEGTKPTLTSCY